MAFGQANIRESVFVHLSGNDFIVGETLHFSSYVYSQQTGMRSGMSKLLYVELLKSNGESVYQTKVSLDQGTGHGNYYIPTNLESGTYHLVAYTRWMKNFNSYTEQPIVIVNPYLIQKFNKTLAKEIAIEFFPEGGILLPEISNRVVLRATDQYGTGQQVSGKIVSKSRGEAIEVQTDSQGYFVFDLLPQNGENFQFILERSEEFQFFDLPKAKAGVSLKMTESNGLFVFKVIGEASEGVSQGILTIVGRNQETIQQSVAINTAVSIDKSRLIQGLLCANFGVDTTRLAQRVFWNGPVPTNATENLGTFSPLSKVQVALDMPDTSNLSISVSRITKDQAVEDMESAMQFQNAISPELPFTWIKGLAVDQLNDVLIAVQWEAESNQVDEVQYLPELRSGLIPGVAYDSTRKPAAGVAIGLAIAGSDRQFYASKSNEQGQFVLPYDPETALDITTLQALDQDQDISIEVEPEFYQGYKSFNDRPLVFDSLVVTDIVQRSIRNQITNAYADTIVAGDRLSKPEQFYGIKSYKLDDYTRFATMRDTFIELIVEVGVSKNETNYDFKMRMQEEVRGMFPENPTLLLLDGGFVASEDLMNLSPYVVDRIEVLNKRYYFGELIFDGILSVVTFKGDRGEIAPSGSALNLVPAQRVDHEVIEVSTIENKSSPNFQDLLYWNPNVSVIDGKLDIGFNTSESTGNFELRVEGISSAGEPISRKAYFKVE